MFFHDNGGMVLSRGDFYYILRHPQGRDVDLLFGLDMLKAHQACIDLEKNVLRIQGREVKFLAEHELPDKARIFETGEADSIPSGNPQAGPSNQPSGASQPFPGSGQTIGSAPAPGAGRGAPAAGAAQVQSRYSEEAITTLMGLGVSREVAISTLDAAGGNIDVAASLLF